MIRRAVVMEQRHFENKLNDFGGKTLLDHHGNVCIICEFISANSISSPCHFAERVSCDFLRFTCEHVKKKMDTG